MRRNEDFYKGMLKGFDMVVSSLQDTGSLNGALSQIKQMLIGFTEIRRKYNRDLIRFEQEERTEYEINLRYAEDTTPGGLGRSHRDQCKSCKKYISWSGDNHCKHGIRHFSLTSRCLYHDYVDRSGGSCSGCGSD